MVILEALYFLIFSKVGSKSYFKRLFMQYNSITIPEIVYGENYLRNYQHFLEVLLYNFLHLIYRK